MRRVPLFIFILAPCLVPGGSAAYAATVTLAWDPSPDDVTGYKIHYGTASKSYQYNVDVGMFTGCTISGLEKGKTYYFAATAHDAENNQSVFSAEIAYTVPVPDTADTDGDGISDSDEINTYGTDPNKSDTDSDGIKDGEELSFWGDNWDWDGDGDGLINLLDPDSDNDGHFDGYEKNYGYDPLDPFSKPEFDKIWLEAEDGSINFPFEVGGDNNASGRKYIWAPVGVEDYLNLSDAAGYAKYIFEVQQAGNYIIWGRIIAKNGKHNSFFVSVDEGEYTKWNTITSKKWVWNRVSDRRGARPVIYFLDAQEHSLIINHREAGTKIDQIVITNDINFIPEQ